MNLKLSRRNLTRAIIGIAGLVFYLPQTLQATEFELTQNNQPARGALLRLKSVGDLDGNGIENLVALRSKDGFNSDLVYLEIGADGKLNELWHYALPKGYLGEWVDFTISDLDLNGRPEIVALSNVVSAPSSDPVNWLYVFEWDGQSFPDKPTTAWGYQDTQGIYPRPNQIIPGDPDGDGYTEFAISFTSPVPRIMILEFSGDFDTPSWTMEYYDLPEILATGLKPFAIDLADLNGDGTQDVGVFQRRDTDLVVIQITTKAADKYEVSNITTLPLDFSREVVRPAALAFGDLSANGRLEAMVGTNTGNVYLLQFSDITQAILSHPRLSLWHTFESAVIGLSILDYNGDSRNEIVAQTEKELFLLEQIRVGDEHFPNFVSMLNEPVKHVTTASPFLGGVLYTTEEDSIRTVTQFTPRDYEAQVYSTSPKVPSNKVPRGVQRAGEVTRADTNRAAKLQQKPGQPTPIKASHNYPAKPDLVVTAGDIFEYLIPLSDDIDLTNIQLKFLEYPRGMKVGRDFTLRWQTTEKDLGFHKIHYIFTSNIDTVLWLYVNSPPVITSLAPEYIEVGHQFLYKVSAEDKNTAAILDFALNIAPGGMLIDSTGLIRWQPTSTQLDTQWVEVKVSDGFAVDHQRFPVYVNSPPVLLHEPDAIAYSSEDYAGQIVYLDANHPNTARVEVLKQPDSLKISSSGAVSWKPTLDDAGFHDVIYQITDDYISLTDSFALFVNAPPKIISKYSPDAQTGKLWTYPVNVKDANPGQTITYLIPRSTAAGVSINQRGIVSWKPTVDEVDNQQFQISVSDGMRDDIQTVTVFVNNPPQIDAVGDSLVTVNKLFETQLQVTDYNQAQKLSYKLIDGPDGLVLSSTGLLSWTPAIGQVDAQKALVEVSDGITITQKYLRFIVNDPPVIVSAPPPTAQTDELYQYRLEVNDANRSQTLAYQIIAGPQGVGIAPGGVLEWTPTLDQVNQQAITINISDGFVKTSQSFTVFVNAPPQIVSKPKLVALTNFEYRYKIDAADANVDSVRFQGIQMPSGAKLNSETGLIRWVPTQEQEGVNDITVNAVDSHGGVTAHSFQVHVFVDPKTPSSQLSAFLITLTGIGLIFVFTVIL